MLSYPRSSPSSHLHCRRLSTRSICLDSISHFNRTATTDDRLALVLIRILAAHRKRRISQTSTATGNQELACFNININSTTCNGIVYSISKSILNHRIHRSLNNQIRRSLPSWLSSLSSIWEEWIRLPILLLIRS
jgi:hypothetical protein